MRKVLILAAAAAVCVALSGCATWNALTNTQVTVVNTAVQLATAKVIEAKGVPAQVQRATDIKSIASEIKGVASGTVTVAQLQVQAEVWVAKLPVSDQILANALIAQVVADLNAKVANGIVDAAAKAIVSQLMDDIVTACNLYIPAPGSIAAAPSPDIKAVISAPLATSSASLK